MYHRLENTEPRIYKCMLVAGILICLAYDHNISSAPYTPPADMHTALVDKLDDIELDLYRAWATRPKDLSKDYYSVRQARCGCAVSLLTVIGIAALTYTTYSAAQFYADTSLDTHHYIELGLLGVVFIPLASIMLSYTLVEHVLYRQLAVIGYSYARFGSRFIQSSSLDEWITNNIERTQIALARLRTTLPAPQSHSEYTKLHTMLTKLHTTVTHTLRSSLTLNTPAASPTTSRTYRSAHTYSLLALGKHVQSYEAILKTIENAIPPENVTHTL